MNTAPGGYACLASFEALWRAPTQEVAAMVLVTSFGPKLGDDTVELSLFQIDSAVADALPDVQLGLIRNHRKPPLSHIRTICLEAILLLEHRYMVSRHSSTFSDNTETMIRLLRQGRAALESGDPAAYLR